MSPISVKKLIGEKNLKNNLGLVSFLDIIQRYLHMCWNVYDTDNYLYKELSNYNGVRIMYGEMCNYDKNLDFRTFLIYLSHDFQSYESYTSFVEPKLGEEIHKRIRDTHDFRLQIRRSLFIRSQFF